MHAPTPPTEPVCLIIAGYDPSGGGGLLADLRAARASGVRSVAAVTAVTAQNTVELARIDPVTPKSLTDQLELLVREFSIGAVKIGMLGTADLARVVGDFLEARGGGVPVVLDPVLAATAGGALFDPGRTDALLRLLPSCALVTPNLPELATLTGQDGGGDDLSRRGARLLLDLGAHAVLVKGGHGDDDRITDRLYVPDGEVTYEHARRIGPKIRGTGCFLATAIACGLLRGVPLADAVGQARDRLLDALATAWFPGGRNGLMSDLRD